jgi:hypothetical protein
MISSRRAEGDQVSAYKLSAPDRLIFLRKFVARAVRPFSGRAVELYVAPAVFSVASLRSPTLFQGCETAILAG